MESITQTDPVYDNNFERLYSLAKSSAGIDTPLWFKEGEIPTITHGDSSIGNLQVLSLTVGESQSIMLRVAFESGIEKNFNINSSLFEKYTDLTQLFNALEKLYTPPSLDEALASEPQEPIKAVQLTDTDFANFAKKFPLALEILAFLTSYHDEDVSKKVRRTLSRIFTCLKLPEKAAYSVIEGALSELAQTAQCKTAKDIIECINTSSQKILTQRDALAPEDPPMYFALATYILKQLGEIFHNHKHEGVVTLTHATTASKKIHPLRDKAHELMIELNL